jgi:uncharacterized protein YbaR (Trm112 family)
VGAVLDVKEVRVALHPDLLKILCCPTCKGDLVVVGAEEGLQCAACQVVYPIRDEIPVMLVDEAVPLAQWEQGVREVYR